MLLVVAMFALQRKTSLRFREESIVKASHARTHTARTLYVYINIVYIDLDISYSVDIVQIKMYDVLIFIKSTLVSVASVTYEGHSASCKDRLYVKYPAKSKID